MTKWENFVLIIPAHLYINWWPKYAIPGLPWIACLFIFKYFSSLYETYVVCNKTFRTPLAGKVWCLSNFNNSFIKTGFLPVPHFLNLHNSLSELTMGSDSIYADGLWWHIQVPRFTFILTTVQIFYYEREVDQSFTHQMWTCKLSSGGHCGVRERRNKVDYSPSITLWFYFLSSRSAQMKSVILVDFENQTTRTSYLAWRFWTDKEHNSKTDLNGNNK